MHCCLRSLAFYLLSLVFIASIPGYSIPGGIKNAREGALDGNRTDQYNLGVFYLHEADGKKAFEWFEKAAQKGHPLAHLNLGVLYQKGEGVNRDFNLARHWIERSAKQGIAEAQLELALLYYWGRGVKKNPAEAIKWFRLSARRGLGPSLSSLGSLYFLGKEIEKDLVRAFAYYQLALRAGSEKARRWITYLSTKLDENQKSEAKRLSSGDFRDLRWGMPLQRFLSSEEHRLEKRDQWKVLGLETSFAGDFYYMEWIFENEVLIKVVLMQTFPDVGDIYSKLKVRFEKLHGSASKEGFGSETGVTKEMTWIIPGLFGKTNLHVQKTESPTLFGFSKKEGIRVVFEPNDPKLMEELFPKPESIEESKSQTATGTSTGS